MLTKLSVSIKGVFPIFKWAITTHSKTRSTWTDAEIESQSSEAVGYPADNAIDGNVDSQWKATGASGNIVIDTGVTTPIIDYIFLRFGVGDVPTTVKIETSDNPGTGFIPLANNMIANGSPGTVNTHLSATLDGTSRIISVVSSTNFEIGNTVEIVDGVGPCASKKYMIVDKGTGWLEVDRYPEQYISGADVTVVPASHCLVLVASGERKRYINITLTCPTTAHIYEVSAFAVSYVFDDSSLPLNPFPVEFGWETGQIARTFSGFGVGRMTSSPAPKRFGFSIQRISRDGLDIWESLIAGDRFGILMDDGQWHEGVLTTVGGQRRQSSESELVSYGITATFEVV
jgi:hypothetical protein